MIECANGVLIIIGLLTVATLISCVVITCFQRLYLLITKHLGKSVDEQTKARYSGIYVPGYIKKLRRIIPKPTDNRGIKSARPVPYLENGQNKINGQDAADILNSPISEFDKSPADKSSHTENLS